ncbi:MAG: hypothetical protein BM562_18535 [Alphaproteobacteria bacterium MedPE-SWcel]|nr:MAG: hypothetical protein BM562_18535 [Alphaproteobacteria bacterium MedPE-SWcel]
MARVKFSTGRIEPTGRAFAAISRLHSDLLEESPGEIEVDFGLVSWADAHLASALRVVVDHSFARGQSLRFINISRDVSTILRKNGFFTNQLPDTYDTTIPWTHFAIDDGVEFAAFARKHLSRRGMPKMSASLRRKFFEGIDEVFANSSLHSRTNFPISVCGQYYPNKKKLAFVISDGGQGIRQSYVNWSNQDISAPDAINWAMQPQSTSRIGDIPGGLGLALIREFVSLNGGVLAVASDKGFWRQDGREIAMEGIRASYPGTSIVLEIESDDKTLYDINQQISANDIW